MENNIGFNQDGEKIVGFPAKCEVCGSENVKVAFDWFLSRGSHTGEDSTLEICCCDCNNKFGLVT